MTKVEEGKVTNDPTIEVLPGPREVENTENIGNLQGRQFKSCSDKAIRCFGYLTPLLLISNGIFLAYDLGTVANTCREEGKVDCIILSVFGGALYMAIMMYVSYIILKSTKERTLGHNHSVPRLNTGNAQGVVIF
jgi:hypothetical protein